MLDAFVTSSRLRITYRLNGILYWLKRLPLLRRLLPANVYDIGWLKTFALILAVFSEVAGIFLGKIFYTALLIFAPAALLFTGRGTAPASAFLHIFAVLSLLGALINNPLFENDANAYYAIFLMRMDARRYALSNYVYYLIKTATGFIVSLALARLVGRHLVPEASVSLWWILLLPLMTVTFKIIVSALNLSVFRRSGHILQGRFPWLTLSLTLVLLLVAYAFPFLRLTISPAALAILCAAAMCAALPAVCSLRHSRDYRRIYQANPYTELTHDTIQQSVQEGYQKKLVLDTGEVSRKSGCAYLNELFVKRHRKMLTRSAKRLAMVLTAAAVAAMGACAFLPSFAESVNSHMMRALPTCLFAMYMVNRGATVTELMFYNCDHSLLAYRFYRQPKVILDLFRERLKTVVRINLLPSSVIAAALPLLLLVSGGTAQPLDYAVLPVSILAMSVFFSVHYLVLYYLLQPYTAGLERKSPLYSLLSAATYLVCYAGMRIPLESSMVLFGAILIAFCMVYIAVALLLAYKLAPKTFKLRQ
ncbi:MAG: hypothetical protein E7426_01920 [Ruminococcaceae bacterium]|nr:hypothetical protein [Oscillospiraceae bacterium]